ncbi:MRR1 Multidrug resistance regulator 1 [Candida maltosa Xu316]
MTTFALGLSILGGQKDRESSLIAQVKSVIPTKKVIWLLIKRYFKLMYAVIPYVIEDDFRHQVEKLIGPESYEDVKPDVKIDNQTDFAHVGILFIVCRLSFLSLFHNRGFYNEQILTKSELTPEEADRKHLILNAINIHIVDVAQACFLHLQRLGRIDFPLLQLGIYLRSYRVFAPEEGDGLDGGDSLNQHSNLLSMCYLLGLNRDPDIMSSAADEKVKHLYRKAWYYALMQEYTLAHTYGTPLYIRPESFDTKRPFMTEENANCRDIEIEKASLTVFAFISALIKGPIKDLILMCNNIGEPVKVSKLTGELNHLELGTFKLLGKVGDYVYTLEDEGIAYHSNKIMKTGILFKMNSLMIIMYCQLFNHYEKTNNRLAFFYFKKTLSLAINEMLPFMLPLITRSQELFGEAADLHINPNIITFLVRVIDVCLIATMRSNFSRLKMSNDPDHKLKMVTDTKYAKFFDSTNRLLLGMEKVCRVCLSACSVLSSRYYFAWAVMKSRTYYLKLVTTSKLYKMNEYEGLQFSRPSEDQLTELAALTERGLKKIESIIEQGCDAINISQLFKRTVPKRKPSKDYEREREPKPSSSSVSNHVSPSISFNEEVSTPQSVDSSGNGILYNTQFEDLKFDNSAEIDSIWLQMLNSKTFTQNDVFNVNPMTGLPDNGPALNENFGYPVPNQFQPSSETIPTETTSANVNGAQNGGNVPTNDQPTGMYFDFFDELPLGKLFNNL